MSPATGSDWEDSYIPDMDLTNDLETGTLADAGLPEIYQQMVIMNRLLGLIVAFFIIAAIFTLMKFTMRLVQDNITNQL